MAEPCLISARRGRFDRHHVGGGIQFYLVAGGAISDRIGRRAVLMGITFAGADATARRTVADRRARLYPHDAGTAVVLFLFSANGAMVRGVNRMMPVYVRTVGFSLAFSGDGNFGGLTLAISTALVRVNRR